MSQAIIAALASAGTALLLALAHGLRLGRRRRQLPAVRHIIILETTMSNAIVGVPKPLLLVALSAGSAVDLSKFPRALKDVTWLVSDPDVASINVLTADGSAAELTFAAAGTVVVRVSAVNINGDTIEKVLTAVGEEATPVVDALDIIEA